MSVSAAAGSTCWRLRQLLQHGLPAAINTAAANTHPSGSWHQAQQPHHHLLAASSRAWVTPPAQCRFLSSSSSSSSSAAATAAVATKPPSSTSSSKKAAAGKKQQPQQQAQPEHDPAALAALASTYQRARMQSYYSAHLARELLLKLNLESVEQLPSLASLDLWIAAKDLYGGRYAEKWQMLLPALALEYVSGQPASYVTSKLKYYRARNAVTAVRVRLTGPAAYDVLQKLAYVVLPSQSGFAGLSGRSFDAAGNLHFRVPRMVNFPDYEEQFEVFENLGALHVSLNLRNVARRPGASRLLLTGLQLPIVVKGRGRLPAGAIGSDEQAAAAAAGAAAGAAQEGEAAAGGEGAAAAEGGEFDGGSAGGWSSDDGSSSSSDDE